MATPGFPKFSNKNLVGIATLNDYKKQFENLSLICKLNINAIVFVACYELVVSFLTRCYNRLSVRAANLKFKKSQKRPKPIQKLQFLRKISKMLKWLDTSNVSD